MQKLFVTLFIYVLFSATSAFAQTVIIDEAFDDGDFTNNPTWTDPENKHIVNGSNILQLDAPGVTDEAVITTPSNAAYGEWEAFVRLDFATSGTSLAKFYILSDTQSLKGVVNGYYVLIGDSEDEISLVRQDGNSTEKIIDGPDDFIESSTVVVRIRVTRDLDGNWELFADPAGGTSYVSQGTTNDNTYGISDQIGFLSQYIGSRSDAFEYDEIIVTKVNPPLEIQDATVQDNSTIDVQFNLDIDPASVDAADFSVDNGVGSPNSASLPSSNIVRLSYNNPLSSNQYTLTVNNVDDVDGNTIAPNSTASFTVFGTFAQGDVIINEFAKDPAGSQSEYVELKNTSAKLLNLQDWTIAEGSGSTVIASDQTVLQPNDFVVISTDTSALFNAYGTRPYIETGLGNLNNDTDFIRVNTDDGTQVDSLQYDEAWGGVDVAIERRSGTAPSTFMENFGDSPNALGGTPGIANEVADDTTPPNLNDLIIADNQTLDLDFSERLENGNATNTVNYSFSNGISINDAQQTAGDSVRLSLDSPLQNGTEYQLTINNQQDIFGNTAVAIDTTFSFFVVTPADSGDIFINEFTYDPPSGSTEYIELFNPTDESFDLNGWTINDDSGNAQTITNSRFVVPPDSFVVIAPDETLLQDFPNIALVSMGSNFPGLNNGSDEIVLRDDTGERLDSLFYTSDWGGENIALERRTTTVAPIQANFGNAPNGFGTPGSPNQVAQDNTPPDLDELIITNNQTLDLDFTEALVNGPASNTANFTLDNGISINAAQQTAGDSVRLNLDSPLQNGTEYQLTISNQQDIFGNTAGNIDTTFSFFETTPADSGDIFINEFTYDPPEGSTEYIELFNPTNESFDLNGWTINDNTGNRRTITDSQFIIPPDSFVVIAPDNTLLNDNPDIALVSMGNAFPSLNNNGDDIVLRDSTGQRLDSLQYDSDWGGNEVALERRTTDVAPIQANFGDAPNGFGTPGRENQIPADNTPPNLKTFSILSNQSLQFIFTEQVDSQTASNISNYTISGELSVNSANVLRDTVQVTLSNSLQNDTEYTVTINGVEDLFGNTLTNRDTTFTYYEVSPADSGDIFINEFTYDPPEGSTEYIELFNPTAQSFDLNGWTINDNTGNQRTITNSQFIVPPDSFIVIAPDNTLRQNNPDIALITMGSDFPSLNNSGDDIVLRNATGQRLDSLQYTPAFGGNSIAIERRTINAPPVEANFGNAPNGFGTPGEQNEIGQDNTPPDLTNLSIPNNQTLTLAFTEGLEEGPAMATGNYTLDNGISITDAQLTTPNTVRLILDSPLQNNISYQLTINNQQDIFGNTAETINSTFTFAETTNADPGDIFINEFTYNPPEGSTEYIELFNPTDESFDLNGWTINDNTGNRRIITDEQFIVSPESYVVLAPDNTLQDSLPNINLISLGSRFPSLNNNGDDIVLRDSSGTRLDSLTYTPAFGGDEVAVERRTINAPPVQSNFGSAPNGFGTPGRQNEIEDDITPPDLVNLAIPNSETITLSFNEGLDKDQATDTGNYTLDNGISVSSARQTAIDSVQLSLDSPLQNATNYQLTISNQQDIFGNTAADIDTSFTFFEVSPADSGEIFINEFTYDPPTGSTEYVELINTTSQSFDLNGWTINDNTGNRQVITNSRAIVPPDSFIVIAPDQTLLSDFPNINLITMGSRFPSLNNSGDDIVVRRADGTRLDTLTYTTDFGGNNRSAERRTTNQPPFQANFGDAPNGFGTPGSINGIAPDEQPPVLNTLRVIDNSTIQLIFSEAITGETATNQSNYTLSPNRDIQLISSVQDTVTLFLSQELQSEQSYNVNITGLQDIFGNTIAETDREFTFVQFSGAQPRDIVINEVLYSRASASDPEFIELFNRTDQNFDLSGWQIGDASNTATIDAGIQLTAGGYLVITENASLANVLDNAVFISDLPSLNDDEDAVYIQNDNGVTIDSLFYNANFGGTIDGRSAERRDPNAASNDAANFATSTAEVGSTPGAQNSVFQVDDTAPTIVFSRIFPNGDIEVRFSEFITLTPDLTFTLGEQILSVDDFDPDNANRIFLNTPSGITPGSEQTITAQNLSDVTGNVTASTQRAVAQPLSSGDVVINEILFDPLSDDEDNQPDQSEYIELRNIRDFAISLEGITLHDAPDEDGEVRTLTPVSTDSRFIPAQGTALIYAEDETPEFNQSKVARFFNIQNSDANTIIQVDRSSLSLASSDDAIFITGSDGAEIDSVFYNETWHNPNLIDTDGIALERINPFGPSNDDSNWGSTTNANGGTPNQENTLFQTSGFEGDDDVGISFSTNPFSPDDDGTDDNLIINYQLDESDFLITVRIYDRYGRLVRELADSEQAGFEGSLIWDGLKDDGSPNRIGFYIVIFEAFDSANGNNRTFKETVVLARRLN